MIHSLHGQEGEQVVYWSGGCWFRTSYFGYIVQMLPQSVDVKFGPHNRDTHTHTTVITVRLETMYKSTTIYTHSLHIYKQA